MTIKTNTIEEYTSASGVTIDGLLIKDGSIPSSGITSLSQLALFNAEKALVVDTAGAGTYETLSAALADISDAAADNRYVVFVRGAIAEVSQVAGKSHVDVIGIGGASVTVTTTAGEPGVLLDGLTDTLWRDILILRAGEVLNNNYYAYALSIRGASDDTVVFDNVVAQNLCTAVDAMNHFAGFVIEGTATPTLRHCTGIGSSSEIYGHGMWWREQAGGRAVDCVGRGGSNGSAASNWGMYILASANPVLVNCAAYGSNVGDNCYGLFIRGAASPTLINCLAQGGDGGTGCFGFFTDDACRPVILGGIFQGGIGGTGCNGIVTDNYSAPEFYGASSVPRQFSGQQTITATTSFVASAVSAHQIKGISWQVDVAGTGGATLAIGTTPGGGEIVAATAITSTGTKYPVLVGVGAELQLAAGATIYVTVTGTGSPSVLLFWEGEYAPAGCYGASLGGYGAVRMDRCTLIGNCYSGYGLVIGTIARTANAFRITNSHIETRRKSTGIGSAIYTSVAYDPAPLYNCTIVGAATNITAAAGTTNGTNVLI